MAEPASPGFPMSELVRRTGVAPATVRYYMSAGAVPPPRRVARNRFLYDEHHVESVKLVRLLRERRHLPLEVIVKMLPELLDAPGGEVFRADMWDKVLAEHARSNPAASPAARLLEAGIAAFDRDGYADVRVEDVCREARLAKGSFYRHFPSKEELFFAAAAAVGERAGRHLAERAGEGGLTADEAVEILTEALSPDLGILLDLVALASQRRPGHGRVLRSVFTDLYRVVRAHLGPLDPPGAAEEVLERALVLGIRQVVVTPLVPSEYAPGEVR
jgi:AcrR family transcriptional regulator